MQSTGYSSSSEARQAREALGEALEALQRDEDVPGEVLGIAQNIARSVGALYEAEFASTEVDGKTCVKSALGTLSQTLALLQDVKTEHPGVQTATESIARVISVLFPLTNKASVRPVPSPSDAPAKTASSGESSPTESSHGESSPDIPLPLSRPPSGAPQPTTPPPVSPPPVASATSLRASRGSLEPTGPAGHKSSPPSAPADRQPSEQPSLKIPSSTPPSIRRPSDRPGSSRPPSSDRLDEVPASLLPPPAPKPSGERTRIEANLGATTQSNFYVGLSGEVAHGGVFLATYEMLPKNTSVTMLVTLPGGFEFECDGYVRFLRDPLDFSSESEPGIGIQFEDLSEESRKLVLRFVRNRPPIFYEVS